MSRNSIPVRNMIAAARALQAPAGWALSWIVRVFDGETEAGRNDHDVLEDALADVVHFQRSGLGVSLEARLAGPVLG